MIINIQRVTLLTVGLILCVMGCEYQQVIRHDQMHTDDDHTPITQASPEETFNQNLQPILTERCALSGCHVANGPHDIDFRTYQSFLAGGDEGAVFIPGNAEGSEIIKEIVSGNMPPGGPPLSEAQIQLFKDWINQQDSSDFPDPHYDDNKDDDHGEHGHDEDGEDHVDEAADHEDDDDEDHEDDNN